MFRTACDEFRSNHRFHFHSEAAQAGGDAGPQGPQELDTKDLRKITEILQEESMAGHSLHFSLSNVVLVSSHTCPVPETITGAVVEHHFHLTQQQADLADYHLKRWDRDGLGPLFACLYVSASDSDWPPRKLFRQQLHGSPKHGGVGDPCSPWERLEDGLRDLLNSSNCWEEVQLDGVMVRCGKDQVLPLGSSFFNKLLGHGGYLHSSGTLTRLKLAGASVDAERVLQCVNRHPRLIDLTCSLTPDNSSHQHREQLLEGLVNHPTLRALHFPDTDFSRSEYKTLRQLLEQNYRIVEVELPRPAESAVGGLDLLALHDELMRRVRCNPELRFREERLDPEALRRNIVDGGFLGPERALYLKPLLKQSAVGSVTEPEKEVKEKIYGCLPSVYRRHRKDYIDQDWSVMQLDLCALVPGQRYSVGADLLGQAAASKSADGIQCLLNAGANPLEKVGKQPSLLVWALTDGRDAEVMVCGGVVVRHLENQMRQAFVVPRLEALELFHRPVFDWLSQIRRLLMQSLTDLWVPSGASCPVLKRFLHKFFGADPSQDQQGQQAKQLGEALERFFQLVSLCAESWNRETVQKMSDCVRQLKSSILPGTAYAGLRSRELSHIYSQLSTELEGLCGHLRDELLTLQVGNLLADVESLLKGAAPEGSRDREMLLRRAIQGERGKELFVTPKGSVSKPPPDGRRVLSGPGAVVLQRSISSSSYFGPPRVADRSLGQPSQVPRLAWK